MQYSSSTTSTDIHNEAYYDLAIIGGGISSAQTLIHYISLLERQQVERPVKILVTEKSGEFWTGIPYGTRSGSNALLISSLKEFIPHQHEREKFIDWLNANRDWVFAPQQYRDGALASKWLQANIAAIDSGMWDELFIPRQTFGLYLKETLAQTIATATAAKKIEIELLALETIDIQRSQDFYHIDAVSPDREPRFFTAKKIVLAIGSPPNIGFEYPRALDTATNEVCYIDNMYEPSLDFNIERICRSLQTSTRPGHRQILMVGSNAGTLDALYCLNNSTTATNLIDKFIILSPNAAFPHRINPELKSVAFPLEHLAALIANAPFTAAQILAAVKQDVKVATARSIEISDIYADISTAVIDALNLLSYDEQKQFVSTYAVEIGKLQRRAGGEYLDVVDSLSERGKLTFIQGKFHRYLAATQSGSGCEYIAPGSASPIAIDAPIGAVINCAGFQDVTTSSSILIQNLIRRGICIPNDSRRGFTIDKNFEASKNCYLMGPLVAGNIDGEFKVWHAESCQRIISLSKQLAEVLIRPEPQWLKSGGVNRVEPTGTFESTTMHNVHSETSGLLPTARAMSAREQPSEVARV